MEGDSSEGRYEKLKFLLSKSQMYSTYLLNRMQKQKEENDRKRERREKKAAKEAERKTKETLDHMTIVCPETEDIRQEYRQPAIYQSFGNDLEQQNKLGQFTNEVLRRLDNCDNSTQPNGQN